MFLRLSRLLGLGFGLELGLSLEILIDDRLGTDYVVDSRLKQLFQVLNLDRGQVCVYEHTVDIVLPDKVGNHLGFTPRKEQLASDVSSSYETLVG